jgi:hypothetical protein
VDYFIPELYASMVFIYDGHIKRISKLDYVV